jgi:hypothetical protein
MTQITEYSGDVPALNQTQPEFDQNTQAFIDYMAGLAPELNAYAAALNTLSTNTTSLSSVAIGTGTKNFTVETGKSLFVGMSYKMAVDANNWVRGDIISYNSGTGALSIDVDTVRGSGTYAAWVGTLSFNGQIEGPQVADQAIGSRAIESLLLAAINDFRLTLTSGTPVTSADVTGATTIYCAPYKGNRIGLYDGTRWNLRNSAQFSLALGTLTSGLPYDVFCYDNAGTPTLEFTAWTNDTTRATALTYQDGILVKTGALTRRYLGTFYTTATTTTEDSLVKRFLWNYYHRVERPMRRLESTATWTYTTDTYRQANNSTANQLDYVCGVAEDGVEAFVQGNARNTNAAVNIQVAVGVDSTTTASGLSPRTEIINNSADYCVQTHYNGNPGVGRHYLVWLERSEAVGTTTWAGNNSPLQSGITGKVYG